MVRRGGAFAWTTIPESTTRELKKAPSSQELWGMRGVVASPAGFRPQAVRIAGMRADRKKFLLDWNISSASPFWSVGFFFFPKGKPMTHATFVELRGY